MYALKIKDWVFVVCKDCTLLQRRDDIPYEVFFNFEGRQCNFDYYPVFLAKSQLDCVTKDTCMLFSLRAIEHLLYMQGYKVTNAEIVDSKMYVAFDKLNRLEQLQRYEKKAKLDNYFSYFLWAVQLKK